MSPKIPIGPATTAGYSVSAASFALAIVAYLSGDRSDQTIGVIVAGAVGATAFAITQLGRYAQAHAHIHAQAQRTAPLIAPGGLVVTASNAPAAPPSSSEAEPPPLTDAELEHDPDMGDPPDAGPDDYVGDPADRAGADDHPAGG